MIQALWNYIKIQGLQDKVDRRLVRADDLLRPVSVGLTLTTSYSRSFAQIFNAEAVPFQKLPEIINRYLTAPEPILLHYTINPALVPPERPSAWDVEIKMEDAPMKSRMTSMLQASKESMQDLAKLDEEVRSTQHDSVVSLTHRQIALHAQSLHNAHLKRTFLHSFARDPAQFIHTWLESQSRDLESVLGSGPSEGATVRTEDLRRSEFFKLPWVEEAVSVQEGTRVAAKGMM